MPPSGIQPFAQTKYGFPIRIVSGMTNKTISRPLVPLSRSRRGHRGNIFLIKDLTQHSEFDLLCVPCVSAVNALAFDLSSPNASIGDPAFRSDKIWIPDQNRFGNDKRKPSLARSHTHSRPHYLLQSDLIRLYQRLTKYLIFDHKTSLKPPFTGSKLNVITGTTPATFRFYQGTEFYQGHDVTVGRILRALGDLRPL